MLVAKIFRRVDNGVRRENMVVLWFVVAPFGVQNREGEAEVARQPVGVGDGGEWWRRGGMGRERGVRVGDGG